MHCNYCLFLCKHVYAICSDVEMIMFLNFAQNIVGGYTAEPRQGDGSKQYPKSMFREKKEKAYSFKPLFYYIKVGCNRAYFTRKAQEKQGVAPFEL